MMTLRSFAVVALAGASLLVVVSGCSSDPATPDTGSPSAENEAGAGTGNGSGTGTGNGSGTGTGTGTGSGTGTGTGTGAGTGSDGGAGDASHASEGGTPGTLGFMDVCTQVGTPGDCAAGLQCHNFSDHGIHCTHPCMTAQDCPAPSSGCGGIKLCKP